MSEIKGFQRFNAELSIVYDKTASEALGKDLWRVTESFRYYVQEKNSDVWVDVPAGYLMDGASVPQIFWNIIPPWGAYGQAAAVHDYLCEYLTVQTTDGPKRISRKRTDEILEEAMIVLGVDSTKVAIISAAVNLYRKISGTDHPTIDKEKLLLEASWRENKNIDGAVANTKTSTVTETSSTTVSTIISENNISSGDGRNVGQDIRGMLTKDWIIRDKTAVESGHVDNKDDLGGETNHGITIAVAMEHEKTLRERFGWDGTMRNLTSEMAYYIYVVDYWDVLKLDQIHAVEPLLADKLFDIGINAGNGRAALWLQTILTVLNNKGKLYPDLKPDGVLGNITLNALNSYIRVRGKDLAVWTVLKSLLCMQGNHYITISHSREANETFTQGWLNRLDHNLMFYAALFKS